MKFEGEAWRRIVLANLPWRKDSPTRVASTRTAVSTQPYCSSQVGKPSGSYLGSANFTACFDSNSVLLGCPPPTLTVKSPGSNLRYQK